MSEPKLLKNTCPQCGGKLHVKKGIFFTFTTCQQCKARYAWPHYHGQIIEAMRSIDNTKDDIDPVEKAFFDSIPPATDPLKAASLYERFSTQIDAYVTSSPHASKEEAAAFFKSLSPWKIKQGGCL